MKAASDKTPGLPFYSLGPQPKKKDLLFLFCTYQIHTGKKVQVLFVNNANAVRFEVCTRLCSVDTKIKGGGLLSVEEFGKQGCMVNVCQ